MGSLLAVDVSIGAMPYWDGSSTGMFGASYFGSVPGSGSDGVVTDGMFSNWTVLSTFDIAEWAEYIKLLAASATDSLARTGTFEAVPPLHLGSFALVVAGPFQLKAKRIARQMAAVGETGMSASRAGTMMGTSTRVFTRLLVDLREELMVT